MGCAQRHVDLATEQVDVAQHLLNEKMSILDRLSAAAKERVNVERNRILQQTDTERAKALERIDQLVEQHTKQIKVKNSKLGQLPLDAIPAYIQDMTDELEYINESNNQLLQVVSAMPTINVGRPYQ